MISFFDNTCARNRRGKSCLPLLIQYLCWKNGNGIRSFPTFSLILVLDKQKRHSRQLSLDRDQSSVSPRERPLFPNPSTHLTPTYSFWYPFFLEVFNFAANLSDFAPFTNPNQLNHSKFFIIQLLFPNESYPSDYIFCSWLPDQPTGSDFFMDLSAVGFPKQDKLDVNLGKYHLLCNNLLIHRD